MSFSWHEVESSLSAVSTGIVSGIATVPIILRGQYPSFGRLQQKKIITPHPQGVER